MSETSTINTTTTTTTTNGSSSNGNGNGHINNYSDFKISISIPPDNPPIARVDQFGTEFHSIQTTHEGRFIKTLNQIKEQEAYQKELNRKKDLSLENGGVDHLHLRDQPNPMNPMIEFTDHMNLARIELEQMIFLIDMIKNERHITLASVEKPPPSDQRELNDVVQQVSIKQKALSDMGNRLITGAAKMKSSVSTASSWWSDVSTLRSKWRLKGKDSMTMLIPSNKASTKKLSIDYGFYTSGSTVDQTEADLSRGNKGEVCIDFPNLPYQTALNKRLYIGVKSRDSKTFSNNSSQCITRLPLTDHSKSYKEFEQLLTRIDLLPIEEARKLSFLKCSNLLNKSHKYQFHSELFETLNKEASLGNTGEIVMQTEKEIRIECGGLNLFIGMDIRKEDTESSSSSTTTPTMTSSFTLDSTGSSLIGNDIDDHEQTILALTKSTQQQENNNNDNKEIIYQEQQQNRLLFVIKTSLKKISTLQMKRAQRQLLMNIHRRTPKFIFGRKNPAGANNDELISKTASILRHMDMFLRVMKVLEFIERTLPVRIKYTPAAPISSSLIIISLVESVHFSQPMVAIEVVIKQAQVTVVQGQSKSNSNDNENLVGSFIVNLIQSYFIEQMTNKSSIGCSLIDLDELQEISTTNVQQQQPSNKKLKQLSSSSPSLIDFNDLTINGNINYINGKGSKANGTSRLSSNGIIKNNSSKNNNSIYNNNNNNNNTKPHYHPQLIEMIKYFQILNKEINKI